MSKKKMDKRKREVWKALPGSKGRYEISDQGRVRSFARVGRRFVGEKRNHQNKNPRVLKPAHCADGRLSVVICVGGEKTSKRIHELVLVAFVGPRPKSFDGAHLDGDTHNNRLSNLVWVTRKENSAHRKLHGTDPVGERHGGALLTEKLVKRLRREARHLTVAQLSRNHGFRYATVYAAVKHLSWKHI